MLHLNTCVILCLTSLTQTSVWKRKHAASPYCTLIGKKLFMLLKHLHVVSILSYSCDHLHAYIIIILSLTAILQILRNSFSGVKQGLKNLTPFPSSKSDQKLDKSKTSVQQNASGSAEDEEVTSPYLFRICALDPEESEVIKMKERKHCLRSYSCYMIHVAYSSLVTRSYSRNTCGHLWS